MQSIYRFDTISDDELLRRLVALVVGSRQIEADLVACIGEVDARRLYVRHAASSMFVYCTERLHLSEAEACLRITAARASREHPVVLEMLADGRLHLSAIAKLSPYLTPENRDELLRRATHRTKREIDEMVAELAPRPDVPPSVRKLPTGRFVAEPASKRVDAAIADRPNAELRPERVDSGPLDGASGSGKAPIDAGSDGQPRSDAGPRWVVARPRPAVIEPLSPARYRVQFTASAELRDKLERLQGLMRSSIPDGDLAAVIEAAVTEKLERLEARRFGRTNSPKKSVSTSDTTPRTRHVPAAVKRAVAERDGGRCRYVDTEGNRCTARLRVQFHHRRPWAVGGDHSPGHVSTLCSVHNRYLAEVDFGRKAVGRHRRSTVGPPRTQEELDDGLTSQWMGQGPCGT